MPETDTYADALEQGYLGTVASEPPDEAYTVSGQGPETVEAERQALRERRNSDRDASRED